MRSLAPRLQEAAACMGRRYTCPVEDHMVFKMENTRTCKSCGAMSTKQEEFTNLSLDLVSGVSVEDLLQEYLKEKELEFSCECGGRTSSYRSSFSTLPQVLILQLKRFRFSPSFKLEKADDPVTLLRDLVLSSTQGGSCYSLISTISHVGCTEGGSHGTMRPQTGKVAVQLLVKREEETVLLVSAADDAPKSQRGELTTAAAASKSRDPSLKHVGPSSASQ
ncbi:ubiquitin carboxyl-terminal hydrolase 37-like [Etheostoma cragini]|uniref:ubiquitin carboxyl-terminal hydrolase 37-like n=1 Tax=Etheostoma cragini TaxID=417921 RepID=UPI00155E4816|nr:ubiquitin carboxyl-terminal hydrolase 37-like [Etheostoma cragini]